MGIRRVCKNCKKPCGLVIGSIWARKFCSERCAKEWISEHPVEAEKMKETSFREKKYSANASAVWSAFVFIILFMCPFTYNHLELSIILALIPYGLYQLFSRLKIFPLWSKIAKIGCYASLLAIIILCFN